MEENLLLTSRFLSYFLIITSLKPTFFNFSIIDLLSKKDLCSPERNNSQEILSKQVSIKKIDH